ncbi:MAG: regulatory protein RecX [Lachnospiraceae bacterium]
MFITTITEGKGKKYRIYNENGYLFSLYGKELKRYHIEEQSNIDDTVISSIMENIIYKRAKERALYLLERRPMTEYMIREKLMENEYPQFIISKVVCFLYEYHYLDDNEYIHIYVQSYTAQKSKKQMISDLLRKGISKEDLELYFEKNTYSDENSFRIQFEKYTKNKDLGSFKERQKVFRYFCGKGYDFSLVEEEIRHKIESR